ncbi:hypothetical protein [Candidatus Chloroploca sp. Khr17]|uniref:hypothetical protein n=1 Tax=Candidatus Chloroploca sp. Khr17 TaxID=2496869 RepID=UPI00101C4AF4|nr:hypothetical protein [Candidatus Chloroploca sp. Khr17]
MHSSLARLIVYACPLGPLAEQIAAFYDASRAQFGPNKAHAYPPHITLTGFFQDEAAAIPVYASALAAAWTTAMVQRPDPPVIVTELACTEAFHGLLIVSPWLESLTADFAARAVSPTRHEAIRLKSQLHLSLAYGFNATDGPALGAMAQAMVDPAAPVQWEVQLYEQGEAWKMHGLAHGL